MNKKRIILGYLFGFFSALLLSIFVLLLLFKLTIGSKDYLISVLERDNYYETINDEIKEEMNLYLLSSGFTDKIIENIYTKDEVVNDIKMFINNSYDGKLTTIDTSEILNRVNGNIDSFFRENNLLTVNKGEITEFTDGLVKIYSDEITLYGFVDSIIPKIPKIIKIIDIGIIVIGISLIVTSIILGIIKYSYFSATIIASGFIILFIRLFIFEKVDVSELLIITEKFSFELRNILTSLENLSLIVGLTLIIMGFMLTIVKSCVNRKK